MFIFLKYFPLNNYDKIIKRLENFNNLHLDINIIRNILEKKEYFQILLIILLIFLQ